MIALTCLLATPSPTVYRIEGEGYFRFVREGRPVFARSTALRAEAGRLVSAHGLPLLPAVAAEAGFAIHPDGTVRSNGRVTGRIKLAIFASPPSGPDSDGLFRSRERASMRFVGEGTRIVPASGTHDGVVAGGEPSRATGAPEVPAGLPSEPLEEPPEGGHVPDAEFLRSGGVEVAFHQDPRVGTDRIVLGQIATVFAKADLAPSLAGLDLGETPAFGVKRTIDRTFVLGRMRLAGFEPRRVRFAGPLRAAVSRAGQDVPPEAFVEAAVKHLARGGDSRWEPVTPGRPMTVPAGALSLAAEASSTNGSEASVTVGVYVDGKRFNARTLRLRSSAPAAALRVGQLVPVRIRSGSVTVQTRGRVVAIHPREGAVTVQTLDSNVRLVGTAADDGSVEVRA